MKTIILLAAIIASSVLPAAEVVEVKAKALDGFGGEVRSVLSRCQTKVGAQYDPVAVTRDINELKDSGEFEDISADARRLADGVEVTFFVKRKIRFHAPLTVRGAGFYSESKIASLSELKDGYLYGEADLAAAAAKVRQAYRKKCFHEVKVVPLVETSADGVSTVTLLVDEGERRKIRSFEFDGAVNVEAGELRAAVGDLPWWNPVGWFSDAPVTEELRAQCIAKIEEVYRNHGYLDVKVSEPVLETVAPGKADVRFKIAEGVQYKIGSMSITGLTRYPESVVRTKSELPEVGAVAGKKILDDAAHRIKVTVGSGDFGLADTVVEVKQMPSAGNPEALDVVFAVTEGVRVVLSDVKIRGNDYTKDKVIRREIALGPGDRMLEDRAERSKRRLENLDYFSRVSYSLEPTGRGKDDSGAEYRDLVYEVQEKNTGSFMVGVGASSVDSVFVSAEVSQSNFDLFAPSRFFRGGGQKGRLYVAAGPRIQTYEASVTEPYLFDRMLELTVEGYRRQRWYDEYDIVRSGGGATLAYPVKFWPTWQPFGRFGVRLSGEFIEFDETEDDLYYVNGTAGEKRPIFKDEERRYGDAAEGVLRLFWNHDGRDNFRIPTRGSRTQLYVDLAGGDNEYYRLGFNHRHYFNVWEKYNHVFMVGLRGETIDSFSSSDGVPIYNRLFLGGPKSIRGIEYRNVSPLKKQADGSDWAPWGGQTLFCMNFEYTVPVFKMLRVAAFSDLGGVGEDDFDVDLSDNFAWTVGIGFRIDIPMFPIRLDFATPIEEPDHCEKEVFSFSVGYDF